MHAAPPLISHSDPPSSVALLAVALSISDPELHSKLLAILGFKRAKRGHGMERETLTLHEAAY